FRSLSIHALISLRPSPTLFPYTTLFRSQAWEEGEAHPSMAQLRRMAAAYRRLLSDFYLPRPPEDDPLPHDFRRLPGEVAFRYSKDRKSTRLNSSHGSISYAVFCLKKKKK